VGKRAGELVSKKMKPLKGLSRIEARAYEAAGADSASESDDELQDALNDGEEGAGGGAGEEGADEDDGGAGLARRDSGGPGLRGRANGQSADSLARRGLQPQRRDGRGSAPRHPRELAFVFNGKEYVYVPKRPREALLFLWWALELSRQLERSLPVTNLDPVELARVGAELTNELLGPLRPLFQPAQTHLLEQLSRERHEAVGDEQEAAATQQIQVPAMTATEAALLRALLTENNLDVSRIDMLEGRLLRELEALEASNTSALIAGQNASATQEQILHLLVQATENLEELGLQLSFHSESQRHMKKSMISIARTSRRLELQERNHVRLSQALESLLRSVQLDPATTRVLEDPDFRNFLPGVVQAAQKLLALLRLELRGGQELLRAVKESRQAAEVLRARFVAEAAAFVEKQCAEAAHALGERPGELTREQQRGVHEALLKLSDLFRVLEQLDAATFASLRGRYTRALQRVLDAKLKTLFAQLRASLIVETRQSALSALPDLVLGSAAARRRVAAQQRGGGEEARRLGDKRLVPAAFADALQLLTPLVLAEQEFCMLLFGSGDIKDRTRSAERMPATPAPAPAPASAPASASASLSTPVAAAAGASPAVAAAASPAADGKRVRRSSRRDSHRDSFGGGESDEDEDAYGAASELKGAEPASSTPRPSVAASALPPSASGALSVVSASPSLRAPAGGAAPGASAAARPGELRNRRDVKEMLNTLFECVVPELRALVEAGHRMDRFYSLEMLVEVERQLERAEASSEFLFQALTLLASHVRFLFNTFVDEQIAWVRDYRVPAKRSGVLEPLAKAPAFVERMDAAARGARSSAMETSCQKLTLALFALVDAVAKQDAKYSDLVFVENFHFFWRAFSQAPRDLPPALAQAVQTALDQLRAHLAAYVSWHVHYELEALSGFWRRMDEQLRSARLEDLPFVAGLSKHDLRALSREHLQVRALNKGVTAMFHRLQKHLPHNEVLLRVVWRALHKYFVAKWRLFEERVELCYPSERLPVSQAQVHAMFAKQLLGVEPPAEVAEEEQAAALVLGLAEGPAAAAGGRSALAAVASGLLSSTSLTESVGAAGAGAGAGASGASPPASNRGSPSPHDVQSAQSLQSLAPEAKQPPPPPAATAAATAAAAAAAATKAAAPQQPPAAAASVRPASSNNKVASRLHEALQFDAEAEAAALRGASDSEEELVMAPRRDDSD
jgi:hypothetical protein